MKLSNEGLKDRNSWEEKGYKLPLFDREEIMDKTKKEPLWIHFGAGNIFRAFQCNVLQNLLDEKILDRGLISAEGYDYEIIEKINRPHDDLSILVTLKADGNVEKTVVGSVVESLTLDSNNDKEFNRLKEIFENPTLQMVSFTITEKGYRLKGGNGEYYPDVLKDFEEGPSKPQSYIGKVASLLYNRYLNGELPLAMVSMDNCSHNGDKLYDAISAFAKEWEKNNVVKTGFSDYVNDKKKVSFPLTMIDKITPRPDATINEMLNKDNIDDINPLVTSKNTYIAPFVNAEECEYLVIEDVFPNGRPQLEKGGILFTDRETVNKVEKMKVCTCLNPLHTALAVFGCLLGYDLISKEMQNPVLNKFAKLIGYKEGLPVVVNPGVLNPEEFIDQVVNVRIPNPFMPDTPQRIATDTSQKLAIRFGETIKAYQNDEKLDPKDLVYIPMVYAGWIRYIMAIDDKGNKFTLSPDPLLSKVTEYVKNIKLGDKVDNKTFEELYHDKTIFGVDLYEAGLSDLVTEYFNRLNSGVGAIEKTLKEITEL